MSKRLNISVSDELASRMEPFKKEFNVSKVCANAIDKEVTMLEKVQINLGSGEYSEAIARLRKSRTLFDEYSQETLENEWCEWGKEYAKNEASFELLELDIDIAEIDTQSDLDKFDLSHAVKESLRELIFDQFYVEFMGLDSIGREVDYNGLICCFQHGMSEFWKNIRPAVISDIDLSSPSSEEE